METYRDHFRGNETNTALPLLRRVVKNIVNSECLIRLGQLIQVFLQQNILLINIRENQINLRLIASRSAPDNSADDLQHGCNTSSSSNHTKVTNHVGCVDHCALWTLDFDCLADDERCHVFGDVTGGVGLDEEVEVTWLVVARDGGVGADDFFG